MDNRPIDVVLKSLNKQPNPTIFVTNNHFNLRRYASENLCHLFIVVTDEIEFFDRILVLHRNRYKVFSRILIIFYGDEDIPKYLLKHDLLNINNKRAMNLILAPIDFRLLKQPNYTVSIHHYTTQMRVKTVQFPLSTFELQITDPFDSEPWSPIFRKDKSDAFQVNVFHCPPFIINLSDCNSSNPDKYRYDGVEYKLLTDVTAGWNIKMNNRQHVCDKCDLWKVSRDEFLKKSSDMLLCSLWMSEQNHKKEMEFSKFYDYQCATFLVPRAQRQSEASYIYTALNIGVWLSFLGLLLVTCILLTALTVIGKSVNYSGWHSTSFETLSSNFTHVIGIATAHGLTQFPSQIPLKILLISWMILSVVIGTGYSTGYTSLLTKPNYSKPVNTVADMLEQNISVGSLIDPNEFRKNLVNTNNDKYIELSNQYMPENEFSTLSQSLNRMKHAVFVKVLSQNYITDAEQFMQFHSKLRLMKDCVFRYYAVFGFHKDSPYTHYFNSKIPRFFEAGIIQHWLNEIKYRNHQQMEFFFDPHNHNDKDEAKQLSLSNLAGVFFLLITGLFISTLVFAGELLYTRWQLKKKQQFLIRDNSLFEYLP